MATAFTATVRLSGGLFGGSIPKHVQNALVQEALLKVDERISRPYAGKRKGRANNTVTAKREELALVEASTLRWPRTSGATWTRKNVAIIRSMAPRVMRKAAQRIAEEMGGG